MTIPNYLLRPIGTLLLILSSGCAILQPDSGDESIKSLIERQEFDKAAQKIEREANKVSTTDLAAQRNYIKRLVHQFERETLAEAGQHEEQGELALAISVVETRLAKVPSSRVLSDYLASLKEERDIRLQRTEHRLLLSEAKYLLELQDLISEKSRVEGSGFFSGWRRRQTERSLPRLSQELLVCGTEALKRQELTLAGECLLVAQQINNNREVQQALDQWRLAQDIELRSRVRTSKRRSFSEVKRLRTNILEGLTNADYRKINENLSKLHQLDGSDSEIEQLVKEKVQELLIQGNRMYRSGQIREARDTWSNVLLLDPENLEATSHIQRAERVLNRLEELRR